jgi:signal transduction histidine kinase
MKGTLVSLTKDGNARDEIRSVIANVGLVLAVQALFWLFALSFINFSPMNEANTARLKVSNILGAQARSATDPTPRTIFAPLPDGERGLSGIVERPGVFRFVANVSQPENGYGVYVERSADRAALFVNGQAVRSSVAPFGQLDKRAGLIGQYFEVPVSYLKPGNNEFDLLVDRDCCRAILRDVYAGPLNQIKPLADLSIWLRSNFMVILTTVSIVIAGIAACLLPLRQNQALLWASIIVSTCFAVGTFSYIDTNSPLPGFFRGIYGTLFGGALSYYAFAALICAWTNGPKIILKAAVILSVSTIIIAFAGYFYASRSHQLDIALHCVRILTFVSACLAVPTVLALLGRAIWQNRSNAALDAAFFLLPVGVAMNEMVGALFFEGRPILLAPISSLIVLVVIGLGLARRTGETFYAAEQANRELLKRINVKDQELDASAAALRSQVAETAIQTERARIMRDMHDGMGGQLLSLLMQTRDPDTPRAELEETVEIAIADLRLLIDSLDSVGDDLEIALAMFKERLAPRLSGAKVTLDWPNTPLDLKRVFSPAEILSIYRILQEAISNALRHGAPTKIIVAQAIKDDQLIITLEDDGKGMDPNASAGRGLTNMRRRIQELGGSMNIEAASSGGTRLVFLVPELS